jgi:phosphohistidine phosphatase
MGRKLILLRHGKSDWGVDVDDFDRPLKKRGKQGARSAGDWLLNNDLKPDFVLTSPAARALRTAQLACKEMGIPKKKVFEDEHLYLAGVSELLYVIGNCPHKAKRVLLVGHNPGLEQVLMHLTNGDVPLPDDGKLLPTATLAILKMPADWVSLEKGCAPEVTIRRPLDINRGH